MNTPTPPAPTIQSSSLLQSLNKQETSNVALAPLALKPADSQTPVSVVPVANNGIVWQLQSLTLEGVLETSSTTDLRYPPGKHAVSIAIVSLIPPSGFNRTVGQLITSGKGTGQPPGPADTATFTGNYVVTYKLIDPDLLANPAKIKDNKDLQYSVLNTITVVGVNCSYLMTPPFGGGYLVKAPAFGSSGNFTNSVFGENICISGLQSDKQTIICKSNTVKIVVTQASSAYPWQLTSSFDANVYIRRKIPGVVETKLSPPESNGTAVPTVFPVIPVPTPTPVPVVPVVPAVPTEVK